MELSLFDLHCDTAFEMLTKRQPLTSNDLAISLERAKAFQKYIQVMALWTNARLPNEDGWDAMKRMIVCLRTDRALQNGTAELTAVCPDRTTPCASLILAVEDARILNGKIERVDELCSLGVRILTPLWAHTTCIGGSHDTKDGLTDFGKRAIDRAVTLGMIPDISHASEASAEDIFGIAEAHSRPVIASHSNLYDLCPVSRNLKPGQVKKILSSGGVIGINLFTHFLREDGNASVADVFRHAEGFLELGAADVLCIGGDLDGAELPDDIRDLAGIPLIAEEMLRHNYPEDLVRAIFFENAYRFAKQNLK